MEVREGVRWVDGEPTRMFSADLFRQEVATVVATLCPGGLSRVRKSCAQVSTIFFV